MDITQDKAVMPGARAATPTVRPPATPVSANDPLQPLRAILRHWPIVVFLTIGLPASAYIALSHETPTYTAAGTMLYAPLDFNPKLLRGVLETNQVTDSLMASQVAVVRSLPVIDQVIVRLSLTSNPAFAPPKATRPLWRRLLGLPTPPVRQITHHALVATLRSALTVATPAGSQLLRVSFASSNRHLAAKIANTTMRIYLDRQRDANLAVLDHAQAWLTRRAAGTARTVEALDIKIAQARAAAGTERGTGPATLTDQEAGQLTDSLAVAETDLATARARLRITKGQSAAAAAASIDNNVAPMRARLAELVTRLDSLTSTEGPNYPAVRAARRAVAALRGQITAETSRQMAAEQTAMLADQTRVTSLRASLGALRHRASAQSILAAPLASLEERRTAERSLLRAQTEQIGTLESQSVLTRPDARIISPATTPDHPSAPKIGIVVFGAGVLGACLGLLAALAADTLNAGFRSGADVSTALSLPCVALIPEVKRRVRRGLGMAEYARLHPFSPFNEQMRALRTSLWLDPGAPRSLAITAARPAEGKSTLAVSLAVSLAASGMKVLVIDCDIRQPSFDAQFDLGGAAGLTDHLSGRVALDQAIHRVPDLMLDVMPAGAVATDALSLFMSPAMTDLMAALRARYDLVILDLPPMFALAEAQVLARAAEATLLCIRWDNTPRRVVVAALALLDQANIHVAGAVLTRVDSARHARAGFADSELYHPRYGGYFRA